MRAKRRTHDAEANGIDRALDGLLDLIDSARNELNQLRDTPAADQSQGSEAAIRDWLYARWYLIPNPAPSPAPLPAGRENLASVLRGVAAASSQWERGWVVLQPSKPGFCVAGRLDVTRVFPSGDFANLSRPAVPVAPGDAVAVLKRLDWVDTGTGFWTTLSDRRAPARPLVRIYWSVGHERIAEVLMAVLRLLESLATVYSLKCPFRAADYARVDTLIVYLERKAWPKHRHKIAALARKLAPALRQATPPLTLTIAKGVALAEDPSESQSFGQHRCAALAQGILDLLKNPTRSRADQRLSLKTSLRKNGINPKAPWRTSV